MKTIIPATARFMRGAAQPALPPVPTGPRPVRRGKPWPGENFTVEVPQWKLASAFADQGFVLPALTGRGPQTF